MKQILWTIILYRWKMWSLYKGINILQLHKNKVLRKILECETHSDVWEDKYPNTPSITTVFSDIIFIIHNVLQYISFYMTINRHMHKNIRENQHFIHNTIVIKKATHLNLTTSLQVCFCILADTTLEVKICNTLINTTDKTIHYKQKQCLFYKCYMFQS